MGAQPSGLFCGTTGLGAAVGAASGGSSGAFIQGPTQYSSNPKANETASAPPSAYTQTNAPPNHDCPVADRARRPKHSSPEQALQNAAFSALRLTNRLFR